VTRVTPKQGQVKPARPSDISRRRKALGTRTSTALVAASKSAAKGQLAMGELLEAGLNAGIWAILPGKQKKRHVDPELLKQFTEAFLLTMRRRTTKPNPLKL
jgi:hypothetical protein